jgi:hypothetical protein
MHHLEENLPLLLAIMLLHLPNLSHLLIETIQTSSIKTTLRKRSKITEKTLIVAMFPTKLQLQQDNRIMNLKLVHRSECVKLLEENLLW